MPGSFWQRLYLGQRPAEMVTTAQRLRNITLTILSLNGMII